MRHYTPKAVVMRYFAEVWNKQHFDLLEQFVAPTCVFHECNAPAVCGLAEMRQVGNTFFTRFPDAQFTVVNAVARQNLVAVQLRVQATHAESGRAITVTGMQFLQLANGQISESWSNWDELGLLQQIGGRIVFDSPPT